MNDVEMKQQQQTVANYMGALAHLLSGRAGRLEEFIEKVELIISGKEPHALQLMQFTAQVRATRRPVMWIHCSQEAPNVPLIGLVAAEGDKVHIIENCMLWMSNDGKRATLIPDNFEMGAFRFNDELRLKRQSKAPTRDFQSAKAAIVRAYGRLAALEAQQHRRGDVFKLPELARAA